MRDVILLSRAEQARHLAQFFRPATLIRRPKDECPGCIALMEADEYGRFFPGCCGPRCLMRPHRLEDETAA